MCCSFIIQNKDHSASNSRTTDNDVQFIPIYTKLDETLSHNASLGVTTSGTSLISRVKTTFYDHTVVQEKPVLKGRLQLYTLISCVFGKVCTKGGSMLTQAYNKVHVYSTVVPNSGMCTCKWLCVCKIWLWLVMFCTESWCMEFQS